MNHESSTVLSSLADCKQDCLARGLKTAFCVLDQFEKSYRTLSPHSTNAVEIQVDGLTLSRFSSLADLRALHAESRGPEAEGSDTNGMVTANDMAVTTKETRTAACDHDDKGHTARACTSGRKDREVAHPTVFELDADEDEDDGDDDDDGGGGGVVSGGDKDRSRDVSTDACSDAERTLDREQPDHLPRSQSSRVEPV